MTNFPQHWYTTPLKFDLTNPDLLLPGKGNEAVSMKGRVVDKAQFEAMKKEYYELRKLGPGHRPADRIEAEGTRAG